jgi:hypothetical protein
MEIAHVEIPTSNPLKNGADHLTGKFLDGGEGDLVWRHGFSFPKGWR